MPKPGNYKNRIAAFGSLDDPGTFAQNAEDLKAKTGDDSAPKSMLRRSGMGLDVYGHRLKLAPEQLKAASEWLGLDEVPASFTHTSRAPTNRVELPVDAKLKASPEDRKRANGAKREAKAAKRKIRPRMTAYLGVRYDTSAAAAGQPVVVTRVVPDSPIAKAGIIDGDRIVRIGSLPCTPASFQTVARTLSPWKTYRFVVQRGDALYQTVVRPSRRS